MFQTLDERRARGVVEISAGVARGLRAGVRHNTVKDGLVLVIRPVHQHVTDLIMPLVSESGYDRRTDELLQITGNERSSGKQYVERICHPLGPSLAATGVQASPIPYSDDQKYEY